MPKKAKAIKSRGKAVPAPAAIPSKPKAVKPKAAKPKAANPKTKRNYEKLITRKFGNKSNPFVVHNAAVNLAHARWAVTPKQYNTIQSLKHPKPKPTVKPKPKPTVKPKPKPLTRSSAKTKTNTKNYGEPVTNLFDNSYRIPKKRRSTRGKK